MLVFLIWLFYTFLQYQYQLNILTKESKQLISQLIEKSKYKQRFKFGFLKFINQKHQQLFDQTKTISTIKSQMETKQYQNTITAEKREDQKSKFPTIKQNQAIKKELIAEMPSVFESKQTMIPFYLNYEFPQTQRGLKAWWEELIQKIIKKKNQIYITYKDLENIAHIHYVIPTPLKPVLKQLKKQSVYIKEQDLLLEKRPLPPPKPWYTNIFSIAWGKPSNCQPEWPFTFAPQQKIISFKIKQRKKGDLIIFFRKQFAHENSRFMGDFVQKISEEIQVDTISVELLLKQMHKLRQVYLGEIENIGDHVIIYSADRKKMLDEMFIRVEKMKCVLKWQMHKLEVLDDKSSAKIANLKLKAKQALRIDDKTKGKVLIAQAVTENNHRQKIQVRMQVFQQKISQIELNEMNKSSIDLLQQAQTVYQEIAVDSEKFDEVMQKERELQMESDNTARKFQQLAASEDLDEEVDRMMREIQEDTQKKVEKKNLFVNLPAEKTEINKLHSLFN